MTMIELRFPANRYHGTGWGRHVNEGVSEWPPSPYRLLRAMYDVWKRKRPELSESEVQDLFTRLAGSLPKFHLSRVVASHTRSYLSRNTEDRAEKTLIFDAFVALPPNSSCVLEWNLDLSGRQRRTLQQLLSGLNYLGRSESWIEAQLGGQPGPLLCSPATDSPADGDLVYLACPVDPTGYSGQRSWFDALTYSSSEILKGRLSGPPAMRAVPYALPEDAVATWLPARSQSHRTKISAAIVELHARVLPMATDSVRIAERIRGRLMRLFEQTGQPIPPLVHGKDENGKPLTDHTQLFILPRSNDKGRIDNVLLYTRRPGGFTPQLTDAIVNIRGVHWIESLRATPAWMGRFDDQGVRRHVRSVLSSTPFITVRHWRKGRGAPLDFLKNEVRRECGNHRLPEPLGIELIERAGPFFAPAQFRRNRQHDPARPGSAFRLTFAEPVPAPFSLGYGCHFGLGLFEAERR